MEGRAAFVLNILPFECQDDFAGTLPNLPFRFDNLATTYLTPLESKLKGSLNFVDKIDAVYVYFGTWCCVFNPKPMKNFTFTPARLENLLRDLYNSGSVMDPESNEEFVRRIPDQATIFSSLPQNYLKIGCVSGPSADAESYKNFLSGVSTDQSFVFLVGNTGTLIDSSVSVCSQFEVNASQTINLICNKLVEKWNLD